MTLRQDCELWVTFDSEDVDSNRGIVRDRSGQGRTLEAIGGPTFGQSSPVGEAVAFDGTDDFIQTLPIETIGTGSFTVASIFTVRDGLEIDPLIGTRDTTSNEQSWGLVNNNASVIHTIEDSNGNDARAAARINDGFNVAVSVVDRDSDTLSVQADGGVDVTDIGSVGDVSRSRKVRIGREFRGTDPRLAGSMAFAAVWSRALSDAEIERLNDMTDRMVTKL